MAKNGKVPNASRADRLKERQTLQAQTLRGDVRDAFLRLVRELPNQWSKMTGTAQDGVIDRIETLASNLVDQAVDIVASRGCEAHIVRLGKISSNGGTIKCDFTAPYTLETMTALCQRQNQEIAVVARDSEQFKGEKTAAESDNIGDLAMPRHANLAGETSEQPEAE